MTNESLPQPPSESQLNPVQRHTLRRIQMLMAENFHRGMVTVIYKGTDQKFHLQVVSNAATREENLDLAMRTVQEVERAETGIIKTLGPLSRG